MSTKARKLLVVNSYGSVEGDVQTLLTALRGFSQAQFDVSVITKPRGAVYKQLQQIPHIRLREMEIGGSEAAPTGRARKADQLVDFFQAITRIVRFVYTQRIETIYTIDRGVAPQIAAIVSRLTGCPFVLNAAYPFYPQNGAIARFVLRQARRIHVHSQYLYKYLVPFVQSSDRLVTIPNAIELERYDLSLTGADVRATYGIGPNDPVVVMTGRLNQFKGQDDLIRAAAQLLKHHPDTHVLIAGRGPSDLQQQLECMIAEHRIGDHVRLIGYVPSIPHLLASADIVTMPSWEEPFGLVALEGMAMAKPVVSTKAGGVPEFMRHKEFGLLIPPRDPAALAEALRYLIEHRTEARAMGQAGRREVERAYTMPLYVRRISETILAAIGGTDHSASSL
ncbi:MAG: glycosyltransferase family 4 protein [Chloroflexales bacterium]|nr:glycosyltransferase family 4 protein [Chloroflexales bacterium]